MMHPIDRSTDLCPTRNRPDDDPFLWLEEIDGEAASAWVVGQNKRSLASFAGDRFAHNRDTARALMDRPDRIAMVRRRGTLFYNFWKDAEHPRGLWRRTSEANYRAGTPVWDVLLDLDALEPCPGGLNRLG